jgi:hypothetical protein
MAQDASSRCCQNDPLCLYRLAGMLLVQNHATHPRRHIPKKIALYAVSTKSPLNFTGTTVCPKTTKSMTQSHHKNEQQSACYTRVRVHGRALGAISTFTRTTYVNGLCFFAFCTHLQHIAGLWHLVEDGVICSCVTRHLGFFDYVQPSLMGCSHPTVFYPVFMNPDGSPG